MGKGHAVSEAYMGMREGEPWPIIAMNVGVGRFRRVLGVMPERERERTYSWQFC